MATLRKNARKNNKWASRTSPYWQIEHCNDDEEARGYEYHGNLFGNSLSPMILEEFRRYNILQSFDSLMCYVIDKIKLIKKFRNYAIDKRDIHIN